MSNQRENVELADYISVVWKRKFIVLLCTFIAMIVAAVFSLLQPNIYRATASVVVLPPKFQTELAPSALSVHTYMNLLKAPELLQAIVDTLGSEALAIDVLERNLETPMQLSRKINLSYSTTLYHLHNLENKGIIERASSKPPFEWKLTLVGQQKLNCF